MGQREGAATLRRLFGGCLVVLVDIRIGPFDLLIDAAGYFVVAVAAGDLYRSESTFRRVQLAANAAAVFALGSVVQQLRDGLVNNEQGVPSGGWSLSGWASDSPTGLDLVFSITGAIVGWALVWYLLTAIKRMAIQDGNEMLAKHARRTALITVSLMVATNLTWWALATTGLNLPVVAILPWLALVGYGIVSLRLVWDAATELTFARGTSPAPASSGPVRALAIGALVVGGASLIYEVGFRPPPPTLALANALDNQPAELVLTPDYLETDVFRPGNEDGSLDLGWSSDLSCEDTYTSLLGIDLTSGETIWEHQIQRQPAGRLTTLGKAVVVIDPEVGNLPPSVAAIEAQTGYVLWQRYIAADGLWVHGTADSAVALATRTGPFHDDLDGLLIDSTGEIIETFSDDLLDRSQGSLDELEPGVILRSPTGPARQPHEPMRYDPAIDIRIGEPVAGKQVVVDRRNGDHSPYVINLDSGTVKPAERYGVTNRYNTYGNANSPGAPVQLGDDHFLVLLGSEQGPNSKLVVYYLDTATIAWQQEHVRSAASAGDKILHDKRTDTGRHEVVTRRLHLVESDDPTEVVWAVDLSVNPAGGNGFLGRNGDGLVFLVEADGDDPSRGDFLVLDADGATDLPEVIKAAGRLGGGPSPLSHVDDDVVVAVSGQEIIWQRNGQPTQRTEVGPVSSLTVVDGTLVAEKAGPEPCDESALPVEVTSSLLNDFDSDLDSDLDTDGNDEPLALNLGDRGGECPSTTATLSAISLSDETIVWSQVIPSQPGGVQTFGSDAVLVVDPRHGEYPPSVTFIDSATGEPRWQRTFEARTLQLFGLSDDAEPSEALLVAEGFHQDWTDGQRVATIIERDGAIRHDFSASTKNWGLSTDDLVPGYRVVSTDTWQNLLASPNPSGPQVVVDRNDGEVVRFDPATGETERLRRFALDEDWHQLGNPASPGNGLQSNKNYSLLLLGSSNGPNSRLEVWNNTTGESWWREHVRSGALAGDKVLYDKRNDADADADVTRELFLVDADDPDDEIWSTQLNVNNAGGNGYLGMVDEGLVFLVEGPVRPGFVTIPARATAEVPAVLQAAGGLGGGASPLSHVDDGLMIAALDNTLIWQGADGVTQRLTLDGDAPISSLALTDTLVLVEQAYPNSEDCG